MSDAKRAGILLALRAGEAEIKQKALAWAAKLGPVDSANLPRLDDLHAELQPISDRLHALRLALAPEEGAS